MKNLLFVLFTVLLLFSCEDNQVNEVALQAKVDNRLYKSADARASINADGSLIIQGYSQSEGLTIKLSRLGDGNFNIGEGFSNYGLYEDLGGSIYTTQPDGEGVVTISEINEINSTLSGTFYFNAILPGIDTIYISKGILYNVPFNDGTIIDPTNAGLFTAKVDDSPFSPITVVARTSANRLLITGSNANASISLQLPQEVEPGSYAIPQTTYKATYANAEGEQITIEGLIVVAEHNIAEKTISGTFSFNTNLVQITEGQFDVTYQ
jgi:hypothetical protein